MRICLTRKFLLGECRSTLKTVLFFIIIAIGVGTFISPLFYIGKGSDVSYYLLNMGLMLIIAVPFCWFGIRNLRNLARKSNDIREGRYTIIEDVVIKKRMLHSRASSDTSDDYCQLDFADYSAKTGKAVSVRRTVYEETQKGDCFYMVYVNNELFGFYPVEKYCLPDGE